MTPADSGSRAIGRAVFPCLSFSAWLSFLACLALLTCLAPLPARAQAQDGSASEEILPSGQEPEVRDAPTVPSPGDEGATEDGLSPGLGQSRVEEPSRRRVPLPDGASVAAAIQASALLDSITVRVLDGRPDFALRILRDGEAGLIEAVGLAAALGRLTWNPETWQGSFLVDSLEVRFVLDTSVFWVDGRPVQLGAATRYRQEALWVPLSIIDGAVVPILQQRCRWDPYRGMLEIALPGPHLAGARLSQAGGVATLTLDGVHPESPIRLVVDAAGQALVEVKGARLPAGFTAGGRVQDGISIAQVRATPQGCEFWLDFDPRWKGVRSRPLKDDAGIAIDFTARQVEVDRGRYGALESYVDPARLRLGTGGPRRRILLELPGLAVTPQDVDPLPPPSVQIPGQDVALTPATSTDGAIRLLAANLRAILQGDFGHEVVLTSDRSARSALRSPSGLPETAPAPAGDCWLGLRMERWPGSPQEFLLCIAGPPARFETVELRSSTWSEDRPQIRDSDTGGGGIASLVPWSQVARMAEPASRRLARNIADHLAYQWEGRPVRIVRRPARVFRGLAMPAVLLYPASTGDRLGVEAISDPLKSAELARSMAFAIDEFLLGLGIE